VDPTDAFTFVQGHWLVHSRYTRFTEFKFTSIKKVGKASLLAPDLDNDLIDLGDLIPHSFLFTQHYYNIIIVIIGEGAERLLSRHSTIEPCLQAFGFILQIRSLTFPWGWPCLAMLRPLASYLQLLSNWEYKYTRPSPAYF
jgi:hypothetical protein